MVRVHSGLPYPSGSYPSYPFTLRRPPYWFWLLSLDIGAMILDHFDHSGSRFANYIEAKIGFLRWIQLQQFALPMDDGQHVEKIVEE